MSEQTYENVYLIVVDASGYSTIVRHNPRDQAARAFDLLRERILARAGSVSAEFRCARTQLWSWRGDGGILAIHDDRESVARDVALTTARDILQLDVSQVRTELHRMDLRGQLRLRLAVHKATIRFPANGDTGTIHSPTSTSPPTSRKPPHPTASPSPRTSTTPPAATPPPSPTSAPTSPAPST